ncbi:MAG: hypothetical protein KJP02_05145 [Octadecabacter sp.]|nr:hypothetical protein [Octadecabacter sp.]
MIRAIALGLTVLLAGSASDSQAQDSGVALERVVSDAERGVRAIITYRPEVMTSGQEELVNSDGSVSILHWHAFAGQFTAEITEGHLAASDQDTFLREAVAVVCPSVLRDQLGREWVQLDGPFLRIFSQCPEVDSTLE